MNLYSSYIKVMKMIFIVNIFFTCSSSCALLFLFYALFCLNFCVSRIYFLFACIFPIHLSWLKYWSLELISHSLFCSLFYYSVDNFFVAAFVLPSIFLQCMVNFLPLGKSTTGRWKIIHRSA